jgi:hypothetical protein
MYAAVDPPPLAASHMRIPRPARDQELHDRCASVRGPESGSVPCTDQVACSAKLSAIASGSPTVSASRAAMP